MSAAEVTSVEGMRADCENINLNKKLAANFLVDVFGAGMKGVLCRCENVAADTNKYWFAISSADQSQIDQLCAPPQCIRSSATCSTIPIGSWPSLGYP